MPDNGELKTNKWSSILFAQAATNVTNTAGLLYVVGSIIGVMIENVGTSGAARSDTYPHGPDGVMIYRADDIVVPKEAGGGFGFTKGDTVYYDDDGGSNKVTTTTTSNTKCGVALETVATDATQVRIDLIGDEAI